MGDASLLFSGGKMADLAWKNSRLRKLAVVSQSGGFRPVRHNVILRNALALRRILRRRIEPMQPRGALGYLVRNLCLA